MRKIDELTAKFFLAKSPFKTNNTQVKVTGGQAQLYLHGHLIATLSGKMLSICLAGFTTQTTCARLNALPNVSIKIKNGKVYNNGEEINPHQWYSTVIDK